MYTYLASGSNPDIACTSDEILFIIPDAKHIIIILLTTETIRIYLITATSLGKLYLLNSV